MALSMVTAAALGACATAAFTWEGSPTPTLLAQSEAPWVAANEVPLAQADGGTQSTFQPARGSVIVAERSDDGLFYVNLAVNGHTIRFVVDTGASVVVLSQADAALADVDYNGAVASVTTANGLTEMRWAQVREVRVGDHILNNVTATVASGAKVSLIGQNVLSKLNRIEIVGDQLRLI